jgi:hypothetical protein
MSHRRLYIVVREIEAERVGRAVTSDLAEADACYAEAFHAWENGPGEGPGDDDAIVTRCWLYSAETSDPADAEAMTIDGRATLIKASPDEYPD